MVSVFTLDEIERLKKDSERLQWFAEHCMRVASIRVGMEFEPCIAWSIASNNSDLRAAIDIARATMETGDV